MVGIGQVVKYLEPRSKQELQDAITDKSKMASELHKDIAKARVKGNEREVRRLTLVRSEYLQEVAEHQADLKLLKRSRY